MLDTRIALTLVGHRWLVQNADMRQMIIGTLLALLLGSFSAGHAAEPLRVAVAASFYPALEQLAPRLTEQQAIRLELVPGASGLLATQIRQGAPFDVFLSADESRPTALHAEQLLLSGSVVRYARGALALWSASQPASAELLQRHELRLAIANPLLAPYGEAARSVLYALAPQRLPFLIQGNNVGQAFSFAISGNADMALISHAQALGAGTDPQYIWAVPVELYPPLFQAGGIVSSSAQIPAAERFLDWLTAPAQQGWLEANGYLPLRGGIHAAD